MKSKSTAGLLALFLGGLGVHRFYLGQTGRGIINVLFCWTFVPAIVSAINGIVMIMSSDEEFDKRYNSQAIQRSILDAIVNSKESK